MAEAVVYGLAQEVLKNLGSSAIDQIATAWGFKAELNNLNNVIDSLKDVLLDAQERQDDTPAIRTWLERLTYVIYAADDLFDEFATLVARKPLLGRNKFSMELHTFFSSSNQIAVAFKFSNRIKSIMLELNKIDKDGRRFSFVQRHHEGGRVISSSRSREQTSYSYVIPAKVIGRDGDKKSVLDLLLPSSCADEQEVEDLPVIPIVGMGGMGKTTLAKLVYNDARVKEEFGFRLWVCVSNHSNVFDIKAIVEKLLMSATGEGAGNFEMDQLQRKWRNTIKNEKYFLVLDDVWNENRAKWLELRDLLNFGSKGSKILVTTRSRKVAKIMGTSPAHELLGLSEGDSWDLFETVAFEQGEAKQKPNLVKIGKQIVSKCGHVPLAIRSLGSFLYGEVESKWLSVKDTSLAKVQVVQGEKEKSEDIMEILKVSYDHLWWPLKNCFAYCAMFPKDYEFEKEMLIELWMAEGFIDQAANEGQILEDVAEEYFLILLQRCFFQDLERNEWGDIKRCKMHDLMHELAEKMAGVKCKVANYYEERISDEKILHLSFAYPVASLTQIPDSICNLKLLRTFLLLEQHQAKLPITLGKSMSLQLLMRLSSMRVLDMSQFVLKSLPNSISKLIHLRYLNLSFSDLEKLPDSITDLWNLQTLKLRFCALKTLPTSMKKLTNLRNLDIVLCDELTHMPSGIEGLTSLVNLTTFIAGHKRSTSRLSWKTTSTAKLSDLKNLNNLTGTLDIIIHCNNTNNMLEAIEAKLSCKQRLTELAIRFSREDDEEVNCDHDEVVLEGLKPPFNIRDLHINQYRGQKLPSWARLNNLCSTLPNLVRITLSYCQTSQEIPVFSQLCFLKYLRITDMERVEYMEDGDNAVFSSTSARSQGIGSLFFPSLVELELRAMKNLEGWWKAGIEHNNEIEGASHELTRQFSKLSKLSIIGCPNLRRLPLCPNIEDIAVRNTNESLSVSKIAATLSPSTENGGKLKRLITDNAADLLLLPNPGCLHQLSYLMIIRDQKLEGTAEIGKVFTTLSTSLQHLRIDDCDKLRSIADGMQHLSALEELVFYGCKELDVAGFEDDDGMPWKALDTSVRSLTLKCLPKLTGLPRGLQHLSNLHHLTLSHNKNLEEIPEWISCLTSLRMLELYDCPKLKSLPEAFRSLTNLIILRIIECPGLEQGCRSPNGSDWPKIQHIPIVDDQALRMDIAYEYEDYYMHAD